jgi:hypothetical protein
MKKIKHINRRSFLKQTTAAAMPAMILPTMILSCNTMGANDRNKLPIVIPQPKFIQTLEGQPIILGENGSLYWAVISTEHGNFFEEASDLIHDEFRRKGFLYGSHKESSIILVTQATLDSVLFSPKLTEDEIATLSLNEQAYIIRMQPEVQSGIWVIGASQHGVYYGATTLIQLLTIEAGRLSIPRVNVQDYPDISKRMCADWVLTWDWEVNGYDWGDGVEAFINRCKRKIDMCARYKVNYIRFLGGRISPGPDYMRDRYARILQFAPELNRYAHRKGVILQYSTTSSGIDHYDWGLPYPSPWVLNRESYPDGKIYTCTGIYGHSLAPIGTTGVCLTNKDLTDIIINRQKQLIQDIEPYSIYLHNIDIGKYSELKNAWKNRCPQCRHLFPDDEPYSPKGYAGAVANFYNCIIEGLRTVKNPSSGYDASHDLEIVFASPGYGYSESNEDDKEWNSDLRYFAEIVRQLKDKRNVQLVFRELYQRVDGYGLKTEEMAQTLELAGLPEAIFMFAVQGADFLSSPNLFVSSPVLSDTFRGCGTLYNFNGHTFSDLQVLANGNYAWTLHASGWVDPVKFPGDSLRKEAIQYSKGLRHSEFLYGQFIETACIALYGEKAAPFMIQLFRLEREEGAIVPLVAWIDYQKNNSKYDWQGQAWRNQQAKKLADKAEAICDDVHVRNDIARLSKCLDVSSRICLLYDACYRKKYDEKRIYRQSEKLLDWMDANFQFEITEPDGGDPGYWKSVVHYIREISIKHTLGN